MKTKFGIMLGVLLIAALLSVMPVSADGAVHVASQDKGISSSFSFSIPADSTVTLPLSVGDNSIGGPTVAVTSNVPYTVSAFDPMNYGNGAKPSGSAGKMVSLSVSTGSWSSQILTNPLNVQLSTGTKTALSGTAQTIYTGGAGTFSAPLTISQNVLITDSTLPTGYIYGVTMTVSGGAS